MDAKGKGDIKIRTKNSFIEKIANVLYIPTLKSNLLSDRQLQENSYIITIQNGVCEIYDPRSHCCYSNELKKIIVLNLKNALFVNIIVLNFLKESHGERRIFLELIHFDICKPTKPFSNGGKRYLITFIDDKSEKKWVSFL